MDVSVIVPCYNGENYLHEALRSLVSQSGPRFEILVIDDGSDDGHRIKEICEEFDPEIVKYHRKDNGGVASALNLGISLARSDVFCWLSHDDLFTPERLSKQWNLWNETTGRRLLFGNYQIFGPEIGSPVKIDISRELSDELDIYAISKGLVNGCTVMASIDDMKSAGLFDEDLKCTQDYDLWLRMEQQGVRFIHQNQVLCETRIHPAQGSKTSQYLVKENVSLWKRIADRLWQVEILFGEDRAITALNELAHYLRNSEYLRQFSVTDILAHIENILRNHLESYRIATLIIVTEYNSFAFESINSVLSQNHKNSHIYLLNNSGRTLELHDFNFETSSNISIVDFDKDEPKHKLWNRGVQVAQTSDYIAFLEVGDQFAPNKLTEQLRTMISEKNRFSNTDYILITKNARNQHSKYVSTVQMQGKNMAFEISNFGSEISTSTVMLDSSIVHEAIKNNPELFAEGRAGAAVAWLRLSQLGEISHIQAPFTFVNGYVDPTISHKRVTRREIANSVASQKFKKPFIVIFIRAGLRMASHTLRLDVIRNLFVGRVRHSLFLLIVKFPQLRNLYNRLSVFGWFRKLFELFYKA